MPDVEAAVKEIVGTSGDADVLQYVISILEDESFEFGDDAEEAFEAIGPVLVGGGCAADDDAAHELCRQLQQKLEINTTSANGTHPNGAGTDAMSNGGTNNTASTMNGNKSNSNSLNSNGYRALTGGPVLMDELTQINLHPSDSFSGKNLIQGVFRESGEEDFSLMSEKDAAKMKKQAEKSQRAQRAVFEAHQAAAAAALAGEKIEVMRNCGGPAVRDVHLRNFSVSNGGADLIADADVVLAYGRRYGLVGRNGTGKTTFLRAFASRQIPGLPDNCQVLHVEQEIAGDGTSVLDAVLACDTERSRLMEEEAHLLKESTNTITTTTSTNSTTTNSAERLAEIAKRLIEIDAHDAEARAAAILAGLSFDTAMQRRPTSSLSGGWRMRVALARALFVQPDILLLDEPTNHLDLHAVLWLQEYLIKWPKTVICVSHAREFLNVVCTDILHLHTRTITVYRGNYDTFEKTAKERLRCAKAQAESITARKAHMQAFIDKFRYNANRAALVQSRIKALERMAEVSEFVDDPEYCFKFPTPPDPVGPPVISFTDVSFAYPGEGNPVLFKDLNFGIDTESRLSIVGPNGIGKSTLLGLISGTLEPTKGRVYRNPKVRLAIFSQHHVDGLDLALTPLQYMVKCFPEAKDPVHRSHLASFGVGMELAAQTMYTLSGGQKSRVALAKITWTKPHILLLDEPSNHLDIDAIDALIAGLTEYKGGVLMVSHDEFLISASVDELWAVENGTVTVFHASYRIDATGSLVGKMPADLGVGFGFANENGNSFTWLRYLGTSMARVFIQPFVNSGEPAKNTANWTAFASNSYSSQRTKLYGDQFGRSFDNIEVSNEGLWRGAVSQMRQSSKDSGKEFFDWLVAQLPIKWSVLLQQLDTTNSGAYLRQGGNPEYIVKNLKQQGYTTLALFDYRCDNLPFLSSDPADAIYWKERWEEYRLMYIGARWMSKFGVPITELYNEPDKENGKCMDPQKWQDHMRIRSQAVKDGYSDSGNGLTPQIWTPTTAASWQVEYAPATMAAMNMPFPGNTIDTNYKAADGYSFHRYGSFSSDPTCTVLSPTCWPALGYNIRRYYDIVKVKLSESGWASLPAAISEFNCFTAATADNASSAYFVGRHVMDFPSTAACLAAQVSGFATSQDPPPFISVHKFVQNLGSSNSASKSRIGKNGLFYGDTNNAPHIVTGSTMSGEAYRLIAAKAQANGGGSKSVYGFTSRTLSINGGARMNIWAIDDSTSYYVYVINESASNNDVKINFTALNPQPNPWSFIVASGTGINPMIPDSTLHGEVAFQQLLGSTLELRYNHPPATVFRFSLPKVPNMRLEAEPTGDATLWANGGGENFATLQVTSSDGIAVTVLKFDVSGRTGDIGIVNAVLQLHLQWCTNNDPQVVTVLGLKDANWDENTVQWSSIPALKPSPGPLTTTTDNFINWWANPPPTVAGYFTIPPSSSLPANGTDVALDVTESVVRDGITSFLVVRMRRYDQSLGQPPSQLPAEDVQGTYTFASKEAVVPEYRPKLLVSYQVTETFPPPESPPPPPVAPPPTSPPPPTPSPPPPGLSPPPPPPPKRRPPPLLRRPPPPLKRRPPPPRRRPPPPKKSVKKPPPPRRRKPPPPRRVG